MDEEGNEIEPQNAQNTEAKERGTSRDEQQHIIFVLSLSSSTPLR